MSVDYTMYCLQNLRAASREWDVLRQQTSDGRTRVQMALDHSDLGAATKNLVAELEERCRQRDTTDSARYAMGYQAGPAPRPSGIRVAVDGETIGTAESISARLDNTDLDELLASAARDPYRDATGALVIRRRMLHRELQQLDEMLGLVPRRLPLLRRIGLWLQNWWQGRALMPPLVDPPASFRPENIRLPEGGTGVQPPFVQPPPAQIRK